MLLWPFNKYPGTDYETFNWEWILKTVKDYTKKVDDFIEDINDTWNTFRNDISNTWNTFRNWVTHEIADMHRDFAIYVNATEGALNTGAIANGAITKQKINSNFLLEILKDYVTPQMYGAVADGVTDDLQAIQDAIASGKPVLFPIGNYYVSDEIVIDSDGVIISGCGAEETGSKIITNGTNAFHIKSGHRLIRLTNMCMRNQNGNTAAGVEISGTEASNHFITCDNLMMIDYKYGLLCGALSSNGQADGHTYLWNSAFRDIKINSFYTDQDCTGIVIKHNGNTSFGLIFERLYINGYKYALAIEATEAEFTNCNFGLNAVNAITLQTVSNVSFVNCNFECDNKITGSLYDAVIYAGYRTIFKACAFLAMTDSNVSMLYWGNDYYIVFEGCRYKEKSGNEMVEFYSKSITSAKYSAAFIGGNITMPRPVPYASRSLQVLDVERSTLPMIRELPFNTEANPGEVQYNNIPRIGNRPIWFDGSGWKGVTGGEWQYLDAVDTNGTKTLTITKDSDRPRTSIVTFRGNSNTVYYVGLLMQYRDATLTTLVPLANSTNCSVTVNENVLTFTYTGSGTQYIYASVVDLI